VSTRTLTFAVIGVVGLAAGPAQADKGHVRPWPVALSETSQKAILLHNGQEELLVLGVELRAEREVEILEFIPFPSEPQVSVVEGDPFARLQLLMREKSLVMASGPPVKGGSVPTAPVELTFSARMGVHDVTVVQVNDAAAFEEWVRAFFRKKGFPAPLDLSGVLPVAEDYLQRGFRHFVFDRVRVGRTPRFAEPLAYRFRSPRIYYPFKDSNLVGGKGTVDLVMVLPGSFLSEGAAERGRRLWGTLKGISDAPSSWHPTSGWHPSSSARVHPADIEAVLPGAAAFFADTPRLYLQALEFAGPLKFQDDLLLDPADLRPMPFRFPSWSPPGERELPFPGYTEEEIDDYCQARPESPPCQDWAQRRGTGG
jgi:hypothetical protein